MSSSRMQLLVARPEVSVITIPGFPDGFTTDLVYRLWSSGDRPVGCREG
jgi:hypothetical protein